MGGITEAIDQCLKNRSRKFAKALGVGLFVAVVLFDLIAVVLLRESPKLMSIGVQFNESGSGDSSDGFAFLLERSAEDYDVSWLPADLKRGLTDFSDDTVDVILLLLVRVVSMLILTRVAIKVGTPNLSDIRDAALCPTVGTQPLLINAGEGQLHQLASAAKVEHLESHHRRKRADVKKNIAIGCLFVVSSAAQIYLGIKVISFKGHWADGDELASRIKTMQGVLFFACVLLINAEAFLSNRLVTVLCAEEGFYVPEFHQHRLFFNIMNGHYCKRQQHCSSTTTPLTTPSLLLHTQVTCAGRRRDICTAATYATLTRARPASTRRTKRLVRASCAAIRA